MKETKSAFIYTLNNIISNRDQHPTITDEQINALKLYMPELAKTNDVEKIVRILIEIAKVTILAVEKIGDT